MEFKNSNFNLSLHKVHEKISQKYICLKTISPASKQAQEAGVCAGDIRGDKK